MSERSWTGPQQDAITARGGSALVSAAAGSGKTAVLVERAIRLICDEENPVDADRLLIVTFSRAAAAEMKQRIGARLGELIRQRPENIRLQRQQALLASAQVSTVDAFCLELVRQNFQDLSVSPDFGLIDEGERSVLMGECAAQCLANRYAGEEREAFHELVELLATGRDDSRLTDAILRIYEFSRSHPFAESWLRSKLALYDPDLAPGETPWGATIFRHALLGVEYCLGAQRALLEELEQDEKLEKAYGNPFRSDIWQLERLRDSLRAGDWDESVALARSFAFEKLGPLRGDDPLKQQSKDARDRTKKIIGDLKEKYLCATEAQFREDLLDLRPKIELLFELVGEFGQLLGEAMADKRRLHFSDVQHLALSLLARETERGFQVTEKAAEVAARYDHVLVDEYQDTNDVQDMLFTCVSQNQQNLFFVGDVKQSIYAFRQAMPEIFMAKKERFYPYASGMFPAKINLDTNFRSRREVTEAVNYLFRMTMSRETGDVEYNEEESLKAGAVFPDYGEAQPELLLVCTQGYEGGRDNDTLEAGAIADRIREMMASGYQVADSGGMRKARLRDFCILMRSPRSRAAAYVGELGRRGIAAVADNAGGFLTAREVTAVVSLLRALDNPLLDIELVAAMMSPLFGFTADEIAEIRLGAKGQPFYTAVTAAAERGDRKAAEFLRVFHTLRGAAAILPADRLLLRLYDETDALSVFRAMELGEGRRANLLLLVEYAASYHDMGYKQLGGFVGFLGRLTQRGGDLAPGSNLGEGADAVRIMSIHKSKGLEFPVVFLADTARQFNRTDLRQNTMLHSKFGFACIRRDYRTRKQFPTVPLQAIRLEAQKSLLSEEMRILYVALTRAREKLIVTGVVKTDPAKKLAGLYFPLERGDRLPPRMTGEMNGYLDWILAALLHHPSCGALREEAGLSGGDWADDGNPWRARMLRVTGDEPARPEPVPGEAAAAQADPALLELLRERADWRYAHLAQTRVPTKLAVSAVAKGELGTKFRFSARPKFLTRQALTPAERGNALHKFMQFSDYKAARDDLSAEAERMEREGFLTPAETESLDPERLRRFFHSSLAARIFRSEKVWRELKFMAECGQDMLGDTVEHMDAESEIVLQGVADCVFAEPEGAVIVDYKTDRVSDASELLERYGTQLRLYRAILGESLGMPVKQCLLYSFALSCEIEVE